MSNFSLVWFVSLVTTGRLGSCYSRPLATLPCARDHVSNLRAGQRKAVGVVGIGGLGLGPGFATDKVLGDLC